MSQDFIAVRGQSLLVMVRDNGPWCYGAFDTLEPSLLDAWDAMLDSKDPASRDLVRKADGKLAPA